MKTWQFMWRMIRYRPWLYLLNGTLWALIHIFPLVPGLIEEKVTNRLRQVTSAIKQDGANQVNLITSGAERTAAVEFARAAAIRPEIVGSALREIGEDKEIADAMFELLELNRVLESSARLTLLPKGAGQSFLGAQLAAQPLPQRPAS